MKRYLVVDTLYHGSKMKTYFIELDPSEFLSDIYLFLKNFSPDEEIIKFYMVDSALSNW